VLVHGWSCDRSYWDGQTTALAGDFRIVTIDVAGHGASGTGRTAWTIESFGEDVIAVMNKLDIKDAVLVGHSMGGDVVSEVARKAPERVKGVIWVDTYKQLGKPRTEEEVQAMVAPFRERFVETADSFVRSMFPANADPALVDRVAADMSSAPPEIAVPVVEGSLTYGRSIVDAIAEVKAPIVAINSDHSPTDTASMTANGVDVVIMPGVGHFPMMEDPAGFNALLKQTIAEKFR
jgi:pimeloyl-ACP methyl ester carboxylesterase